jgi:sugar lactone lactonase YvrE
MSTFTSFDPDSGGSGTKLIIRGSNFGNDSSYLKVTVNGKKANIVGVNDNILYAIVPARADTGVVALYVGKGDKARLMVDSSKIFYYQFSRTVSTLAGQQGQATVTDGSYSEATFRRPWSLTHDKDGVIYEINEGRGTDKNGCFRRLSDNKVETLIADYSGPFESPTAMAFNLNQDTLYMTHMYSRSDCDASHCGLIALSRTDGFLTPIPLIKTNNVEFMKFSGLAVNPVNGDVIFSNNYNGKLYRYEPKILDRQKAYIELRTVDNKSSAEMRLVFSKDGKYLYEIMKNLHCIYRTTYDPVTHSLGSTDELVAGVPGSSGYQNGIGSAAMFNTPSAGDFDEDGYLYIADKGNHCIRRINCLTKEVTLYAGQGGVKGYKDGTPQESLFNSPEGLTVLDDQSIIVADRENSLIRKIVVE